MRTTVLFVSMLIAACRSEAEPCADFDCGPVNVPDDPETTSVDTGDPTADGDSSSDPQQPYCTMEDTRCTGKDSLRLCDVNSEEILNVSCTGYCGSMNMPSLGCGSGEHRDSCYCDEPPEPCAVEGVNECLGAAIRGCTDGFWEYRDCDAECVAAGYPGAETDCQHDGGTLLSCACRHPDESCLADSRYCGDDGLLRYCYLGAWKTFTCDEACAWNNVGEGLGCVFSAGAASETCVCT